MKCLTLLLVLLPTSVFLHAGLLDTQELRRLSYDVIIGEQLLWFPEDVDMQHLTENNIDDFERRIVEAIRDVGDEFVVVTSGGGQRFACSLPQIEALKTPIAPVSSRNPRSYADAIAASFYVEKCIRMHGNHWWSYVLCRGQTVEQEHGEPGQDGYAKNILGLFNDTYSMPPFLESTKDRLLYVEESYSSGTFCDLPEYREPRKTTVRYECDRSLNSNEARIDSVIEVRPCQYLMTVKVLTLCYYLEFLPVDQANTHFSSCNPYPHRHEVRPMLERRLSEQMRRAERERKLREALHAYHVATGRLMAMKKAERRFYTPDRLKKVNAEMDMEGARYDLIFAYFESVDGAAMTEADMDRIFKLGNFAEHQPDADYETIDDENRAHLWHYFHEATWPKSHFPKDIYKTAVQNAYFEEATEKMVRYAIDEEYLHGLREFLRTGDIDLDNHMAVSASAVYFKLIDVGLANTTHEHFWLHRLYEVLYEDDGEHMEELLLSIDERHSPSTPFDYHSIDAIDDLFGELSDDLYYVMRNGERDEHEENPLTGEIVPKRRKFILDFIQIKPADESVHAEGYDYVIHVKNETRTLEELETYFGRLLTPFCQLLSIRLFQAKVTNYYHLQPLDGKHLTDTVSREYKFHANLAADFVEFRRLLALSTLKHLLSVQQSQMKNQPEKTPKYKPETLIDSWIDDKPRKKLDKMFAVDAVSASEAAFTHLFDYTKSDRHVIDRALIELWEAKVQQIRLNYWLKDFQARKQMRLTRDAMRKVFATKGDSVVISISDISTGKMDELLEDDENAVNDVLDLFFKTAGNKNAQVQVSAFDEDGNDISDLSPAVESLREQIESSQLFRDNERAYAKNFWKAEESVEEKKKTVTK